MALDGFKAFIKDTARNVVDKVKSEEFQTSVKDSIRKTVDSVEDNRMKRALSSADYREYKKDKQRAQRESQYDEYYNNRDYDD